MSALLEVLNEVIARILASHRAPGPSHHLVDEGFIGELRDHADRVRRGDLSRLPDLRTLFLPTGPLGDIAVGDGWPDRYLELAARFDSAVEDPDLRGEPPEVPACPGCRRRLEHLTLRRGGRTWGGGRPAPRPELWWSCPRCDWLGFQRDEHGRLRTMRRMRGDEADCVFCGSQESNVVSETWQEPDGELRDWVVCLTCARSNPRRVGHARTDDE